MTHFVSNPPFALPVEDVLKELSVDTTTGLTSDDVQSRRRQYGPNLLRYRKPTSAWVILFDQFKSLIVGLLVAAAGLSFALGDWVEGAAIAVVVAINAAIGFFSEHQAVRSMESLRTMARVKTRVLRGGESREVPAEELVPGDVVLLDGGDVITADVRLIEASKLQCDESTFSGESMPVSKQTAALPDDAPLVERINMAFKGTAVTRGTGKGIVTAIGFETELGHIATLAEEAESSSSPLEQRLDRLSRQLLWITLVLAGIISLLGILSGKDLTLMVQTGIALAVAAVPEGLPIVATLALARGMQRMAQRNVLVERLSAIETLGATTVIFTDKTGTLTENRMTVTQVVLPEGDIDLSDAQLTRDGSPINPADFPILVEALRIGALCNNAAVPSSSDTQSDTGVGDPTEIALLVAASKAGIDQQGLLTDYPEVREDAFDPDSKMMATFHSLTDEYLVAVKGAPEAVLAACTHVRQMDGDLPLTQEMRNAWDATNTRLAGEGRRILALATKQVEDAETGPYSNLTLLGLVAMHDPPRSDVPDAIRACRDAGIRVVMVTGDQVATARNIAEAVGLTDAAFARISSTLPESGADTAMLYARVSPKDKLDLIAEFQRHAHIVAMTGDGVNDAPALKKADIGIAMGQRGTQVAREAADMVLRDDKFSSIVEAIRQGRIIFGNIRKFVVYLLSCNLSEILVVSLATVSGMPLPLFPLQILFLNLVTDVFPAFALGAGRGEANIMTAPPRPSDEGILGRRHWIAIGGYGAAITLSVLAAFGIALRALELTIPEAVTVSFLTLGFAQLWHVFNMRDRGSSLFRNDITANPLVWGALVLCVGLLFMAVHVPIFADVLRVSAPTRRSWLLILGASVMPYLAGQIAIALRPRRQAARRLPSAIT